MVSIVDVYYYEADRYGDYIGSDNVENMSRDGFSALAAVDLDRGATCGAVVWQDCFSQDEDADGTELLFFDSDEYEAAMELLQEFFAREEENGGGRAYFELSGISDEAKKALSDSGFILKDTESRDIYCDLKDISNNKALRIKKLPEYVVPISEIDDIQFRQGITKAVIAGNRGVESDLPTIPKDWFDQDVSCCIKNDNRITGLVLVRKGMDEILMPVLLYSSGVEGPKELMYMLSFSANAAEKEYGQSMMVRLRRHDEKTYKLVGYFCPGAKGENAIAGERN